MIYVRDENVDFYDALENKSDFINESLKTARLGGVNDIKVTEVAEETKEAKQSGSVHDALDAMRKRDKARLAEYRKQKGLYDPTEN